MTMRPCKHNPPKATAGKSYDINIDCRTCWNFLHNVAFNLKWGGDGIVVPIKDFVLVQKQEQTKRSSSLPCIYFGLETGDAVQCLPCGGSVKIKTFSCRKHGVCTPQKKLPNVMCCISCLDYSTEE